MQCHKECRLAAEAEPSLHGVWKSNCNALTGDDQEICNPISSGRQPLRTLLCKVYTPHER